MNGRPLFAGSAILALLTATFAIMPSVHGHEMVPPLFVGTLILAFMSFACGFPDR